MYTVMKIGECFATSLLVSELGGLEILVAVKAKLSKSAERGPRWDG